MAGLINPAIRECRNTESFHKTKEKWLNEESILKYRHYAREYDGGKTHPPISWEV